MTKKLIASTAVALCLAGPSFADMDAAKAFLDSEIGDLSTLSRAEQEAEDYYLRQLLRRGPSRRAKTVLP